MERIVRCLMKRAKILIVDDRVENLIAMEKVLAAMDAELLRAGSGNEALALTLDHDFALALLDVQMPGMDGYETAELLRQNRRTAHLPVIFVSAVFSGEYYQVRGIESGAVDFLEKPIVPQILRGKVAVFLDLYRQRRQLEEANAELVQNRDVLHSLVEQSSDGFVILDPDGSILFANHMARAFFGDCATAGELFTRILVAGGRSEVELEPGGEEKIVLEVSVSPTVWRGKRAYVTMWRDITERKKLENSLRAAAAAWRRTFDAISDLVSVHDRQCRFVRVNKALADFLGVPVRELVGRHCYEEMHGLQSPVPECPHLASIREGVPVSLEVEDHKRGKVLQITTSPYFDGEGDVAGCVHIARDVTAGKEQERQLQRYSEQLEELVAERTAELQAAQEQILRQEKLAAIGRLAASVRHDLRNPLGVIGNSVYFLKLILPKDNEKVARHLRIMEEQVRHCDTIIGDLLDFSKDMGINLEMTDLEAFCRRVLGGLNLPAGIRLDWQVEAALPQLPLDEHLMRRVLLNLVNNAVQAMPAGGRLQVSLGRDQDHLVLRFSDSGPGIPADILPDVFTPLFSTKPGGIGLGLSIVKDIVERHQGSVRCESGEGKGASFVLRLPLGEAAAGAETTPLPGGPETAG